MIGLLILLFGFMGNGWVDDGFIRWTTWEPDSHTECGAETTRPGIQPQSLLVYCSPEGRPNQNSIVLQLP